jgi:hypothetical protein
MKYVVSTIIAIAIISISLGAQLAEMDDDTLARAFNGWSVPGYSETKLESELGGSGASTLVQKCMADERLRKTLPAFPKYMTDGELRDELIRYILEKPGVWYSDEAEIGGVDTRSMLQVTGFVGSSLRKEFFLEPDDADLPKLSAAIFRESTRYLVADLFERLSNVEKSKRQKKSPEVIALVEELRQTLRRLESAEKTGGGHVKSLPRRNAQGERDGAEPRGGSGDGQTNEASLEDKGPTERGVPARLIFVVTAVVLVALGGALLFRSRQRSDQEDRVD